MERLVKRRLDCDRDAYMIGLSVWGQQTKEEHRMVQTHHVAADTRHIKNYWDTLLFQVGCGPNAAAAGALIRIQEIT